MISLSIKQYRDCREVIQALFPVTRKMPQKSMLKYRKIIKHPSPRPLLGPSACPDSFGCTSCLPEALPRFPFGASGLHFGPPLEYQNSKIGVLKPSTGVKSRKLKNMSLKHPYHTFAPVQIQGPPFGPSCGRPKF